MGTYCKKTLIFAYGLVAVRKVFAECIVGTWGQNCEKECGKCGGNRSCSIDTGYCDTNCLSGWTGPSCIQAVTPISAPISSGLIGSIIALIGIIIVVVIAVTIILILRHMNKGRPLKQEYISRSESRKKSQIFQPFETKAKPDLTFYESIPMKRLDQSGTDTLTANRHTLMSRKSLESNYQNIPDIFIMETQFNSKEANKENIQSRESQTRQEKTEGYVVVPVTAASRKSAISVMSEDYALDLGAQFERAEHLIGLRHMNVLHL